MTNAQIILDYAYSHDSIVVRRDLMKWVSVMYPSVSLGSCDVTLRQMVKDGLMESTSRGVMSLVRDCKMQYLPRLPEQEVMIFKTLKQRYPYTKMCIWHSSFVSSFAHHVPYTNNTIVEVERIAAESVFHDIKDMFSLPALFAPSTKDYLLYSSRHGNIIVRPMISESPTIDVNGVITPSLEKILVDITIEPEFGFARDSELYTIYENIFDRFSIDKRKMLRYASRRGKREETDRLINQ